MMNNNAANDTAGAIGFLLQPWRQLAVQLSPLIGDSGFCALFGRAARLSTAQFSWLASMPSGKSIDALLVALGHHLASAGHVQASLANEVLLTTFTKLLTGLIGGALTMQILDSAPAGATAMPVQEQK
jgi:uncharacterized membrane protein YbjE (DUF340 family)